MFGISALAAAEAVSASGFCAGACCCMLLAAVTAGRTFGTHCSRALLCAAGDGVLLIRDGCVEDCCGRRTLTSCCCWVVAASGFASDVFEANDSPPVGGGVIICWSSSSSSSATSAGDDDKEEAVDDVVASNTIDGEVEDGHCGRPVAAAAASGEAPSLKLANCSRISSSAS